MMMGYRSSFYLAKAATVRCPPKYLSKYTVISILEAVNRDQNHIIRFDLGIDGGTRDDFVQIDINGLYLRGRHCA